MSKADNQESFFALYSSGRALESDVDDHIENWHKQMEGKTGTQLVSLASYLGLTTEEYSVFINDESCLPYILTSRRSGKSLTELLEGRLGEMVMAARSSDNTAREALRLWIIERKKRA